MLPEVILFAQADHVVFGDADRLGPDIIGLVIVLIDRDIQAVSGDFQLFGQELPSPGNDLFLEIILDTFAQNNNLICIFHGIFFTLTDKFRSKT